MLPFKLLNPPDYTWKLSLYLHCVGWHEELVMTRLEGYPAYQVFLTTSGRGVFRFAKHDNFIVEPGYAFLAPAGIPHEYFCVSSDPWEQAYVGFTGALAQPLMESLDLAPLSLLCISDPDQLLRIVQEIWQLASVEDPQMHRLASVRIYEFLVNLRQATASASADILPGSASKLQHETVQKAVNLFHEYYHERLSLTDVAQSLGYTRQHLARLFRKVYGLTPHRYLEMLRLQEAGHLLEGQRGMLVQDVADRVGFEDTAYFIRTFKRYYGVTPKQFPYSTGMPKL